jgi:HSP20 family molecular chaperone IbpA
MVDLATLAPGHRDDVLELVITADLPGVDEKDVEVTLSGDTLTIKGEKKIEHEEKGDDGRYTERRVGSFSRSIRLPLEVEEEEIDANFDDGVLTIRVHKSPQAQKTVRRIEVKRTRDGDVKSTRKVTTTREDSRESDERRSGGGE